MKTPAADIIFQAQMALQDPQGLRWGAAALVQYLNDGQRTLAALKPDIVAVTQDFTAAAGARQQAPDDAMSILEVRCTTGARRRAVTRVEQHAVEAVQRDWQSLREANVPAHYILIPNEPGVFYLYPPVLAGATIELVYARYPQDVSPPSGPTSASVIGTTALEHKWASPLLDYVLYRAWMMDAEHAANAQLAAAHMSAFTAAVGAQAQAPVLAQPTR